MTFNHGVPGSNPGWVTKSQNADVAELADALDLGSSGRPWGFKSLHPHVESFVYGTLFLFYKKVRPMNQ